VIFEFVEHCMDYKVYQIEGEDLEAAMALYKDGKKGNPVASLSNDGEPSLTQVIDLADDMVVWDDLQDQEEEAASNV
jgi:hypothetical protein